MPKSKKKAYKISAIKPVETAPVTQPPKSADEQVEESPVNTVSYSEGAPRRHHTFFVDTGDFFLQVEKAIFRIHRYLLITHSQVWKEDLSLTQGDQVEGSEENPWVLGEDDKHRGWELLLSLFYRTNPLIAVAHTGQESLEVLEIAHKYRMEIIEQTILSRLENAHNTPEFVDLLMASRIVQSGPLQEQAMKGLLDSPIMPDLNEAKRLGLDVYYALSQPSEERKNTGCRNCSSKGIYCRYCNTYQ